MTQDGLLNIVLQSLPDNIIQAIEPKDLRLVLNNIINSMFEQIVQTSASFKGSAIPADDPGDQTIPVFYLATEAGTYTNFGGVVVSASSLAVIAWNGTSWSVSQTTIPQPQNKINDWASDDYDAGEQVNHGGQIWEASEAITAGEEPGVSDKWTAIVDFNVGLNQVSDIFIGKNIIDKSKIIGGSYYSPGGNNIGPNTNYRRTNYIKVEEGKTYTYSGSGSETGGYFANDGDTNGISVISFAGQTFTVPTSQGINYIVLNVTNGGQDDLSHDGTVQLELGNTATDYQPYTETRLIPDDKLKERYAKESDVVGLVVSDDLFDIGSFNKIDPSAVDFTKRYSTGSKKMITADSNLIAASAYIKVQEGEFYTISGDGIYNIASPQGGYFANENDINSVDNITFATPVTGPGKFFTVPTGLGINYVIISLATNADHSALPGNAQMEVGEQATDYQPYEVKTLIKESLLPDNGGGGGGSTTFDAKAWYTFVEGEMRQDMARYMPNFKKHWLLRDKDLVIINTGTSLTARSIEHNSGHPLANERPPLMHSLNWASYLWDKVKWDNQFYRRYDYSGFFQETGSFITTFNLAEWDDGLYRSGMTRYSEDSQAAIAFQIPTGAYQFNLIYRTDSAGSASVKVTISEGDGQVEVYDESDSSWKEANAFLFSMNEPTPVTRTVSVPSAATDTFADKTISTKANTTYQKRLKMRCKGDSIDSRASVKNVTIANQEAGRFMYWGVEWSPRPYMLTFINAARGSHNTQAENTAGLPRFADNEVWGFKPDLIFSELPIHNDGAGGASGLHDKDIWGRLTNNFVFRSDYELSMLTRSQALNGYTPEIIMFTATITWNFGGINDDGTLKVGEQQDGTIMTALDKYDNAVNWWIQNQGDDYGIINYSRRFVEACIAIWGDLKTATVGSGKNGNTSVTDEGSHPNDTGSKLWAKSLVGCFDFV